MVFHLTSKKYAQNSLELECPSHLTMNTYIWYFMIVRNKTWIMHKFNLSTFSETAKWKKKTMNTVKEDKCM